jgi:hypothetical protein
LAEMTSAASLPRYQLTPEQGRLLGYPAGLRTRRDAAAVLRNRRRALRRVPDGRVGRWRRGSINELADAIEHPRRDVPALPHFASRTEARARSTGMYATALPCPRSLARVGSLILGARPPRRQRFPSRAPRWSGVPWPPGNIPPSTGNHRRISAGAHAAVGYAPGAVHEREAVGFVDRAAALWQ